MFLPTGAEAGFDGRGDACKVLWQCRGESEQVVYGKNRNASLGLVRSLGRNTEVGGAEQAGMNCRGGAGTLNTLTKLENLCH